MNRAFWAARRPGWVAGGLTAFFIAAITAWLFWDKKSGVDVAVILTLTVSLVSLAVAAWGLRRAAPLEEAARELADRVAEERGRARRQALGMSGDARPADVAFRSPSLEAEPELVRWRSDGGAEFGTLADVAGFYRRLERGRLVVLGEPGSGKTVLATQLVIDMIADMPDGELQPGQRPPVPVWLSLTSVDLGEIDTLGGASAEELKARLDRWIAEQMAAVYQVSIGTAERLVRGHWVVPVLDGLDEMDSSDGEAGGQLRPRATAVARALNAGTGRRPVVLVCRRREYGQLARSARQEVEEPVLLDASQIVLDRLDPRAIREYLISRFPGHSPGRMAARWEEIEAALEAPAAAGQPGENLAKILARPWRLFLAVMAYHDDNTDPSELLRFNVGQATRHLMTQLIPAATRLTPSPVSGRYPPDKVRDWLAILARHLADTSKDAELRWSPTDLRLERLWPIAGRRAVQRITRIVILAIASAALAGAGLIWVHQTGHWLPYSLQSWIGLIFAFAVLPLALAGTFAQDPSLNRLGLTGLRSAVGRRKLAIGLAIGLAVGPAVGLLAGLLDELLGGLPGGLSAAAAIGLVFGLGAGLATGLGGSFTLAARPSSVMRQNVAYLLAYGLVLGLAAGLTFGLTASRASELAFGLVVWLALGLSLALALGLGVWVRYFVGCWLARRKAMVPPRVAEFLDWAYQANLLRMSGTSAQFRHRDFQDWLVSAEQPASETPPGPQSIPQVVP